MKKILNLVLVITTVLSFFSSCSSDNGNSTSGNSNIGSGNGGNSNSKIIGTWGTKWNDGTGIAVHPKFTFLSNGNVKYYTYFSGSTPQLEEIGTWAISGDIITMDFPETVDIKFKNKIIYINDSEFEFEEITQVGYDTWNAELYYKTTDPNLN